MQAFLESFRCGFNAAMPGEKWNEWDMFSGLQSRCGVTRAEPASVIDDGFPGRPPMGDEVPGAGGGTLPRILESDRVGPQGGTLLYEEDALASRTPAPAVTEDSARSDTARSDDMAVDEREKEKQRLQRLLKDFAKECVAGVPVNLVNTRTGRMPPYFFQMDRRLATFSLRPSDGSSVESVVEEFLLRDAEAIYKGQEVCNRLPFLGLDAASCVGIDMGGAQRGIRSLTLHFDDTYERDKFYTSLQVLKMSVDIQQSR